MKSVARIGNVALHPIFVAIPVICWLIAFASDIAYTFTQHNTFYVVSFLAMVVGVLGAGLALGAGVLDYFGAEMSEEAYHIATFHMLINLMAVVLYTINIGYRSTYTTRLETDPFHWGISFLLEIGALGLVMLSGLLGRRVAHGPGGVLTNDPVSKTPAKRPQTKSGRH